MRIDITMAKFTKRAIMLSLLKLLKQKSVDKVRLKIYVMSVKLTETHFIIILRIYTMFSITYLWKRLRRI